MTSIEYKRLTMSYSDPEEKRRQLEAAAVAKAEAELAKADGGEISALAN